jgi:hypothetical protein
MKVVKFRSAGIYRDISLILEHSQHIEEKEAVTVTTAARELAAREGAV